MSQVVDGDTLKIVRGGTIETIRLIGIDTPEVGGNRTVVECFGQEASRMAAALLNGGRVRIELDPTQDERDEFGRLLAYVWLADGTFVNQKLVEDGYAYEYTYDQPYRYQREFRAAQAQARTGEAGLWSPSTCGGADTAAMLAEAPQAAPTAEVAEPPQAPPPAEVAPPQPQTGVVVISMIHYDGDEPRSEGDEYAQITNSGGSAVNLGGWRLNAGDPGQDFVFPSFELQPGASCRVYTNQTNGDSCGGTFGSGQARWNNDGDCGYLFDSSNQQVSEWCY